MRVCMFEKLCNVVTIANIYIDFDTNCTVNCGAHTHNQMNGIYLWCTLWHLDMNPNKSIRLPNAHRYRMYTVEFRRIWKLYNWWWTNCTSCQCVDSMRICMSIWDRWDRSTAQSIESLHEFDSGRFTTPSKLFNRESNTAQCLYVNSRNLIVIRFLHF